MAEEIRVIRAKPNPMPLIVFIILFAASFLAFAYALMLYTQQKNFINKGYQEGKSKAYMFTIDELHKGVGLNGQTVQGYRQGMQVLFSDREKAVEDLGTVSQKVIGDSDITPEKIDSKIKELSEKLKAAGASPEQEITTLYGATDAQQSLLTTSKEQESKLNTSISELTKTNSDLTAQVSSLKEGFDKDMSEAREISQKATGDAEKARQDYDQRIQQLTQQFEQSRDENNKRLTDLVSENQKIKEELAGLKKEVEEARPITPAGGPPPEQAPVGKILVSDPERGSVIINRGRNDHIVRGQKFFIGGLEKESFGQVEVLKVYPLVSYCSIVGSQPDKPILEGDPIFSKTYAPDRALVFVLVPPFARATPDALKAKLESYGDKVETEVSLRTSAVIVGDAVPKPDTEANVAKARQLGVPVLREAEVNEYIGAD